MPDIVVICAENSGWFDLAQHILISLGLPQVSVCRESETESNGAHSQIAFGPEEWEPDTRSPGFWRITSENLFIESGVLPKNYRSNQPSARVLTYVRRAGQVEGRRNNEIEAFDEALFWAKERLIKGSGLLRDAEILEWMIFIHLSCHDPEKEEKVYTGILNGLHKRSVGRSQQLKMFEDSFTCSRGQSWKAKQRNAIGEMYQIILQGMVSENPGVDITLTRKFALQTPVLIVARQLLSAEIDPNQNIATDPVSHEFLEELLGFSTNALRLISLEITASLIGFRELCLKIRGKLKSPEWISPNNLIPRMKRNGSGLCFSPLTALRYFQLIQEGNREFRISSFAGCEFQVKEKIHWQEFGYSESDCTEFTTHIFDGSSRKISRSLVDNWCILHSAPCRGSYQFKLSVENYTQQIRYLEEAWLELFRFIQNENNRALVRLLPWPSGKNAAFSLRYDVDRPVSETQIKYITDIQQKFFQKSCASWYYFPNDSHLPAQRSLLQYYDQEIGVHLETVNESVNGLGTTHHSAVTSDYWRGDQTIEKLDQLGAEYGEFLAGQISTPRPAWILDSDSQPSKSDCHGRIGEIWLTPIAFPLEGSTNDTNLDYFFRLKHRFSDLLDSGGHAIISSHPDLNQDILQELLSSLDLSNVWVAPIGNVIKRCKKIFQIGNINVFFDSKEEMIVSSKTKIADLHVQVFLPSVRDPIGLSIDLHPGIRRQVLICRD